MLASLNNQVDNYFDSQVDNLLEANKKSAPKGADSSQFRFDFHISVRAEGIEPSTNRLKVVCHAAL
jgi:hypothetical protein